MPSFSVEADIQLGETDGLPRLTRLPEDGPDPDVGLNASLAVWLAKLACWGSKTFAKGGGTSLPGKLALKFAPKLLGRLASQLPLGCWVVTGTNGKTTTAGLTASFLRAHGMKLVHNELGSNMQQGITTALSLQTNWQGRLQGDLGLLEVDEASLPDISKELPLQGVLVTNLFRDQLDRYGELDTTAHFISKSFPQAEKWVCLNADDPLVANLATKVPEDKTIFYFGLAGLNTAQQDDLLAECPVGFPQEVTDCPKCGAPLTYSLRTMAHLGHYDCPSCSYSRPEPRFAIEVTRQTPTSNELQITDKAGLIESFTLSSPLPGLYNLYNLAAAMTLAVLQGVEAETIQQVLATYHGVFGRAEERIIQGRTVRVLLIKNPAGASEVLRLVAQDRASHLLIAINDNYADGRDVSWLWDATFEWLATREEATWPVRVSGERAADMAVRLAYAGLPREAIAKEGDLLPALKQSLKEAPAGGTLYILPTYTALLNLTKLWDELT